MLKTRESIGSDLITKDKISKRVKLHLQRPVMSLFQQSTTLLRSLPLMKLSRLSRDRRGKRKINEESLKVGANCGKDRTLKAGFSLHTEARRALGWEGQTSILQWTDETKIRFFGTAHKEEEHPTYSWLDDLPWHNVSIEWKIWWFFWNYEEPSEAELEVFLL